MSLRFGSSVEIPAGGPRRSVLMIEERGLDACLVRWLLESCETPPFDLHVAESIREGIAWMESRAYDAVLLNPVSRAMPASAAVEAVLLRADVTPVIVLLGRNDDALARQALRMGAQDALVLGELEPSSLERTIDHAVERHRAVARLHEARRQAEHSALHDPLTGLPNRRVLLERTRDAIEKAGPEQRGLGLFFLDLDGFKAINDRLGHAVGDGLLQAVSRRMCHNLRSTDVVARLGGDEFVVLAPGLTHADDAARIARGLVDRLAEPFVIAHRTLRVTVSVGVALHPGCGKTPEELLRRADAALYEAKATGGNTFRFDIEEPAPYSPARKARRHGQRRPHRGGEGLSRLWDIRPGP